MKETAEEYWKRTYLDLLDQYMKKQTAVEWLQEAMTKKMNSKIGPSFLELFVKAKAMEKEQIIEAYKRGESEWNPIEYKSATDYYNHTFKKKIK